MRTDFTDKMAPQGPKSEASFKSYRGVPPALKLGHFKKILLFKIFIFWPILSIQTPSRGKLKVAVSNFMSILLPDDLFCLFFIHLVIRFL
jgi:hypothetical protein